MIVKGIVIADIKDWHSHIVTVTLKHFEAEGEVPPAIHALNYEGKAAIIPLTGMGDENHKAHIARVFKQFCKDARIVASVFISEIFFTMRELEPGQELSYESLGYPSQAPDKVEGLMIICETSLGSQHHVYEIKRDKEKPYLKKSEQLSGPGTEFGGRFSNFLQKPYSSN